MIEPQGPVGPHVTLGSKALTVTTAQPSDAGENLNRLQIQAPGINLRSTVASGKVGEQLRAAGGIDAVEKFGRNPSEATSPISNPMPPE